MTLPKRPIQHVTDDMAMDAISSAVHGLGWVFRPFAGTNDYGIDGEIEIRNSKSQMTGAIVRVQIKGNSTTTAISNGISVKTSTIRYWLASPIPIFMVRVTTPQRVISIFHVESYLIEQGKLDYIQNTSRKTFRFRFGSATPFEEYKDFLEGFALEHQAAVLDISNYSLYNPASQIFGYYRLVHHNCDIDAMLKDMRQNASDTRLIYDYGAAVLIKKKLEENPNFINEIKKLLADFS